MRAIRLLCFYFIFPIYHSLTTVPTSLRNIYEHNWEVIVYPRDGVSEVIDRIAYPLDGILLIPHSNMGIGYLETMRKEICAIRTSPLPSL